MPPAGGRLAESLLSAKEAAWQTKAEAAMQLADEMGMLDDSRSQLEVMDDENAKKPANSQSPSALGIVLVPDVLAKTPPFIDDLRPDSSADNAGLRRDDLILFVNGRMVSSCKELLEELSFIDHIDPVQLTVQRENELVECQLKPR